VDISIFLKMGISPHFKLDVWAKAHQKGNLNPRAKARGN